MSAEIPPELRACATLASAAINCATRSLLLAVMAANMSCSILISSTWLQPRRQCLERRSAGFGDGVVLLARTTAHADRAHDFSVAFQRNASSEDHNLAIVGDMNAKELSARLRMRGQVLGPDIERARGVGLLHGNIDAADPRAIHAHVGHEVAALVGHRDVHGLTDFLRLLFGGRDHAARICKIYSRHYSSPMSYESRAAQAAVFDNRAIPE